MFGQDIVDVLYWTATENKKRKREHYGTILHLLFAVAYVCTSISFFIGCHNFSLVSSAGSVFGPFNNR